MECSISDYLFQVLGLTMLDDLHMVHRDLKPDNILVSPTGHLAIADFGFAKHFSAKTWPTAKMTQAMGTPGYFPPEMFSKDLHAVGYTSSVDRWGLGMILLEMFLGEVSFEFFSYTPRSYKQTPTFFFAIALRVWIFGCGR